MVSGAGLGFPIRGGANLQEGVPTYDFAKYFQKNRMKLRTFWAMAGALGPPLDPSLVYSKKPFL